MSGDPLPSLRFLCQGRICKPGTTQVFVDTESGPLIERTGIDSFLCLIEPCAGKHICDARRRQSEWVIVFARSVLDLVGHTPIIRLDKIADADDATVLGKVEFLNPSGSIKDRIAKYIIERAEADGRLTTHQTILEASSGNTAISLAMIASVKGYRCLLVVPENVSAEKVAIINAFGAKVIFTPKAGGTGSAYEAALKILEAAPKEYFMPNQFHNPDNVSAHYETTGQELLEQVTSKIDVFVAGIGTGGTLIGTGKRLREDNPELKIVAAEPYLGETIPGLRNMREPHPPSIFDDEMVDERVTVTLDEAQLMRDRLAQEMGLFVGPSSGAAVHVAMHKARQIGKESVVVVILPDSGARYLRSTQALLHKAGGQRPSLKPNHDVLAGLRTSPPRPLTPGY